MADPQRPVEEEEDAPAASFPSMNGLRLLLGAACVALLAALAGLTVVDVVGRYQFSSPAPGAYELTQLMLAALIFAALPLTTAAGEHVAVDIVYNLAPRWLRRLVRIVVGLLTAAALTAIAWRLSEHAMRLADRGAITDDLAIPLSPVAWFGAAAALLSGVLALMRLVDVDEDPT